jgi:hypothetical protein
MPAVWLGLACAAGAFAFSGSASALPLVTISGSARGLYGSALGDPEVLSFYGPGLGLRAGVTLPASLYLGASLDYFFGESKSISGFDASSSLLQVLANVGYDLGLGPLTLRPNIGLGLASSTIKLLNLDESDSNFVLSPGAEVIVGLGLLAVSGEVRYNKIFADGDTDALILGVGIGFTL